MQSLKKLTSEQRVEFWSEHVWQWQQSGLTKTEYCRRHGLSRSSLLYWCTKLDATYSKQDKQSDPDNSIVPVTLQTIKSQAHPSQSLCLQVSGYQVDIPGDFQPEVLTKLIRTLEDM